MRNYSKIKKCTVLVLCVLTLSSLVMAQNSEEVKVRSNLEILDIASGNRTVVYSKDARFEAPNWSRDGEYFLFNEDGKIYKLPVKGGEPVFINTGFAVNCNNDHGISPDGKTLAVSHHDEKTGKSLIFTLPVEGGTPKQVTPKGHSYWHGWSPDGKILAYCAERNGEYDVYSIPAEGGGEETKLTNAKGLDDGPDYSPDGKYIYFNSVRTGTMEIWRMAPDGSNQEQITFDKYQNWFAHPSPDGKWLIFVSFLPEVPAGVHPPNKQVMLRLMPINGGKPKTIVNLFGGQGTINVPSWSPDSKKVAFVSYELIK